MSHIIMFAAKSITVPYTLFLIFLSLPCRAIRDIFGAEPVPDESTVHAFYSADEPQLDGLCGSIHSLLVSCSQPQRLVVDVAVKPDFIPAFQARFGMKGSSLSATTTLGAVIQLHPLDEVKMSFFMQQQAHHYHERASLEKSVEKYARFFMDKLVPDAIVVHLDTDVVVQSDVLVLADRLAASGKTMAFVARRSDFSLLKQSHAGSFREFPSYNHITASRKMEHYFSSPFRHPWTFRGLVDSNACPHNRLAQFVLWPLSYKGLDQEVRCMSGQQV